MHLRRDVVAAGVLDAVVGRGWVGDAVDLTHPHLSGADGAHTPLTDLDRHAGADGVRLPIEQVGRHHTHPHPAGLFVDVELPAAFVETFRPDLRGLERSARTDGVPTLLHLSRRAVV